MNAITENATYQMIMTELAARRAVIASGIVVLAAAWLLPALFETDRLSHIPIVGRGSRGKRRKTFTSGGAWELYDEGYARVGWALPQCADAHV